jgi:hypothetical protein
MASELISKTTTNTFGYSTSGQINSIVGDQLNKNAVSVTPTYGLQNSKKDKSDSFIFTNRPSKDNSNYSRAGVLKKGNITTSSEKTNSFGALSTNKTEEIKSKDDEKERNKKENEKNASAIYQPPLPKMLIMQSSDYERLRKDNPYLMKKVLDNKFRYNFPHAGVDLFM